MEAGVFAIARLLPKVAAAAVSGRPRAGGGRDAVVDKRLGGVKACRSALTNRSFSESRLAPGCPR